MIKITPKILLVSTLLVVISISALAGDGGRQSQFSIGSGTRSLGLGGGNVGLADDASALFYNQAAMASLDYQEVDLMHATLFEGSIYDIVTYVYPTGNNGSFGISYMRLGTEDIIKRTDWIYEYKFGYSIQQLVVGYGREVEGGFCLGTALKLVNQSMDKNSTYGVGVDLSFYKLINNRLSIGILFQDIIPARLKLSDSLESTPYNIVFGVGIRDIKLSDELIHRLNFAVEVPEENSIRIHTGIELTYRERLDLRIGFDRDNLAFGAGFSFDRLKINYTYRLMDGITDSHRFGISFSIGSSITEKRLRETELESARGSHLILDDRQKRFGYFKDIADDFFDENKLDSAFAYYQRALAYNQNDKDAQRKIEKINKIQLAQIERVKLSSTDDELQTALLDGYYDQAKSFYEEELYTSSLGVIETALNIDADDYRFIALRDRNNRSIENLIADLLDQARESEKKGQLTEAISFYSKILEYSPGDETVKRLVNRIGTAIELARLISRGLDAYYKNQIKDAEDIFLKVLDIDAGNSIATEYLRQISNSRQIRDRQKELENDSDVWQIYLNALEHYQNGEYKKAISLWEEVLKSYPGNEQTLENIKQARLRLQSE